MPYHRGAVLTGQTISLRITFTDDADNLVDPDATPVLYIYDDTADEDTIQAEAAAKVYTSAVAGPLTSTQLSTGYYEYVYTVPSAAAEGTWHDLWVCQIDSVDVNDFFTFTVTQGANLSDQALLDNTMVVVQLEDTIANLDGDETLESTTLYYTTRYNPLYASPDLVRLELGRWVDWIPDDTLALMLHWASKEADFIHGAKQGRGSDLEFARTKFVVYEAALRALMIPGQGQTVGYASGQRKTLGDLSITGGDPNFAADEEVLKFIRERRDEWWRVVNGGGNIVPGQGFTPAIAVKGRFDPDRRLTGRLWESPSEFAYPVPAANRKKRRYDRLRGRYGFHDDNNRRNSGKNWIYYDR